MTTTQLDSQSVVSQRVKVTEALARLEEAWQRTDAIFDMVRPSSLTERPIALRHPLIFYVGHLPAFTRNLLVSGVLERAPFNQAFDSFFDFGIDPEEGQAKSRPKWPDLMPILAYRNRVRDEVRSCGAELLKRASEEVLARDARILHLVREHEEMHHETLLYMLHELGCEHMQRPAWWREPVLGGPGTPAGRARIAGGSVELGAGFNAIDFGWDNEFPLRTVAVESFQLDRLPITLADYREFVEAGGYGRHELWTPTSWAWVTKKNMAHPKDWVPRAGTWFVRTMFEHVPLDDVAGWPVYVSLAEARAFARWKGARIPKEEELIHAAYGATGDVRDDSTPYPWGETPPGARHGNAALLNHGPVPVGSSPAGASAFGVQELLGNGWEWTETPFAPHPGFDNYVENYAGYSRDFFDGKHFVLFGASWATSEGLLRKSFRNWFRFNYPYAFTKFRLAWSD